jgi:hypothetical protein
MIRKCVVGAKAPTILGHGFMGRSHRHSQWVVRLNIYYTTGNVAIGTWTNLTANLKVEGIGGSEVLGTK